LRKKKAEHPNHERWLVSYADFITLLFAFFVVMFAISQVDAQKLGRFVESVNVAFALRGVFPETSPLPSTHEEAVSGTSVRPVLVSPKPTVLPEVGPPSRRAAAVYRSLEERLRRTDKRVRLRFDPRGVVVMLSEAGFFESGSAEVLPDSLGTLREAAVAVCELSTPVAVEGHTDDVPISTALFPSNWELSTARATRIVRYLVEAAGCDPTRLSATGYAEYRPLGDNSTAAGRALNRRVDLVVLTDPPELRPPR
jgi:chemotaxis protein MotB